MGEVLREAASIERPPIGYILDLLQACLTLNYFRFESTYYTQLTGTSMGAPMAPMYANSFMYIYEKRHILEKYATKILQFMRFIDDILLLWTGTIDEFELMMQELNHLPSSIRFTWQTSVSKINFLDLQISIHNNEFGYTLYSKETDRNTLLHASSFHPDRLKKSLPISQFIRVLRNNSNPDVVENQLQEMHQKFKARGYSEQTLDTAYVKALQSISEQRIHLNMGDRLVFPQSFHPNSDKLRLNILDNWRTINKDSSLPTVFQKPPIISYRKGKSLKVLLVHTDKWTFAQSSKIASNAGCFRCLNCLACNFMTPGKTFNHPRSGKVYKIKYHITCQTTHVIYRIICPCGLIYVGKTSNDLRERMRGHRSTIRTALSSGIATTPVSRHFLE
ncbi:Hypothetical predicted protein, partial [Pelobates cultripes]